MSIKAKKTTCPSDFFECPLWRYDDSDDLYHPVETPDDLPESERELSTRAIFTTPSGKRLDGYVVGISRVFSIGLFSESRLYHANKNLKPETGKWMQDFVRARPDLDIAQWDELFPLKYETQIRRAGYRDFAGTFDLNN
jgi:hypothetical protein